MSSLGKEDLPMKNYSKPEIEVVMFASQEAIAAGEGENRQSFSYDNPF